VNKSARWLLFGIAVFAGFAIAAMSGCTVISKAPELRECLAAKAKVQQQLNLCEDVLENEKRP
jgi:hypothetical protein